MHDFASLGAKGEDRMETDLATVQPIGAVLMAVDLRIGAVDIDRRNLRERIDPRAMRGAQHLALDALELADVARRAGLEKLAGGRWCGNDETQQAAQFFVVTQAVYVVDAATADEVDEHQARDELGVGKTAPALLDGERAINDRRQTDGLAELDHAAQTRIGRDVPRRWLDARNGGHSTLVGVRQVHLQGEGARTPVECKVDNNTTTAPFKRNAQNEVHHHPPLPPILGS